MREIAEFRVVDELASRLFTDNEGERLEESVRRFEIATDDARFERIGQLQRETRQTMGGPFSMDGQSDVTTQTRSLRMRISFI